MNMRQCPYCGLPVAGICTECPHCHAVIPEIGVRQERDTHSESQIRKGLLCVLLAAVIHYFAAGYSSMQVPYPIDPIVTVLLSPLLFLSGIGLAAHGYCTHRKALTLTVRHR
jgi:hypothetical protein